MLKNYFKIALRTLLKSRLFSLINISGLALSLSVCMVIILVIMGQLKQDQHVQDKERIYRVNAQWVEGSSSRNWFATSPLPIAKALTDEYTSTEESVRIRRGFGNHWIKIDRDLNIPVAGFYVDHNFLEFFSVKLMYGDAATALKEPYSTVVTEETARKLFDTADVIGEVIDVGDLGEYTITGVVESPLPKSHIVFEALASSSTLSQLEVEGTFKSMFDQWDNYTGGWVYMKLKKDATKAQAMNDLAAMSEKYDNPENEGSIIYDLQSITNINPGPFVNNAIGPIMPMVLVYFLGGLCLIVIVTAGFNYTNLSIAKSLSRTKEVGVRKVNGAVKKQIFTQFLIESVIITLLSFILATVFLVSFFKPAFEGLTFASVLDWGVNFSMPAMLVSFLFALVVGGVVGLLPASILSSFKVSSALKGESGKAMSKVGLRKTLLVAQFALSLVFIITMVLVDKQFNLMTTHDYGFNANNIITLRVEPEAHNQLKASLAPHSSIKNVSSASHILSTGNTYGATIKRELADEDDGVDYFMVDENYLENLSVPLLAGETFPEGLEKSENERFVLINELAREHFGFSSPHEAINETLFLSDSTEIRILGVFANYHHQPLLTDVNPMVLRYDAERFKVLQIKFEEGKKDEAIAAVTGAYKEIYPNKNVQLDTLKAEIEKFYDVLFGDLVKIFGLFSTLAIVIASMGLLGMVSYSVQLRLKEVSVRKVLGASQGQLVNTLSKGFLKLLLIGIGVALPLAWYLNNFWLDFIAIKADFNIGVILIGVGIILAIGGIIIGSQTVRASLLNPVKFLKDE